VIFEAETLSPASFTKKCVARHVPDLNRWLSDVRLSMPFNSIVVSRIGGGVMSETGVRRRTSIRLADHGSVEKTARIKAFAGAESALERGEREQVKIEVGVKAFVEGKHKDSREFIEMERLAILSQQHERICSKLAESAAQRRDRELKICALSIFGMLVFVAAIVMLTLR
jgi:hypothetical protein